MASEKLSLYSSHGIAPHTCRGVTSSMWAVTAQ